MSAIPVPAPVEAPARPARRPDSAAAPTRRAARRGPSTRRSILGGVVWIVAFAVLLAGVVALNVAVLQLNLRLDSLARERAQLKDANAALAARLSSAGSPHEVERLAQRKLKLVPAGPDQTTYVTLRR